MNAALQCLNSAVPFREHFLLRELNNNAIILYC